MQTPQEIIMGPLLVSLSRIRTTAALLHQTWTWQWPNIVPIMYMQLLSGGVPLVLYLLIAMLLAMCLDPLVTPDCPEPHEPEASELNWSVGFHDGACTSIILIGSLSHACTVIAPGCTFMRPLITTSYRAKNLSHWIRLDAEFRSDLAWWSSFLDTWNGCRDSNYFFLHAFRLDHSAFACLEALNFSWGKCSSIWVVSSMMPKKVKEVVGPFTFWLLSGSPR